MKKTVAIIISLVMLIAVAACSQTTNPSPASTPASSNTPPAAASTSAPDTESNITVVPMFWSGGSPTGFWSQIGTTILELVKEQVPHLQYTVVAGGGYANPIAVSNGDTNIGLTFLNTLNSVLKGHSPYDKSIPDHGAKLSAIARLDFAAAGHFAVTKAIADKYGLKTVGDLVEKKVPIRLNAGQSGSGDEFYTTRTLEAYGCTYDDIKSWGGQVTFADYDDAADRYVNGQCDAIGFCENIGLADTVELCSSRDTVFLSLDQDAADYMKDTYGYLYKVVPAGTYPGQDSDVLFAYDNPVIFVNSSVPEDLVYEITKVLLTSKDKLVMSHNDFKEFEPSEAWTDIPIELNPGAARAYKELGYIK